MFLFSILIHSTQLGAPNTHFSLISDNKFIFTTLPQHHFRLYTQKHTYANYKKPNVIYNPQKNSKLLQKCKSTRKPTHYKHNTQKIHSTDRQAPHTKSQMHNTDKVLTEHIRQLLSLQHIYLGQNDLYTLHFET